MIYDEIKNAKDDDGLRSNLLDIEEKIKAIVGEDPLTLCVGRKRHEEERHCEGLSELIHNRYVILNKMFRATPDEMKRLEYVNNCLYQKTKLMYSRTAELYRTILRHGRMVEFDDDYEVEGTLQCCIEDEDDVLVFPDDEFYGSDFKYMMQVVYSRTWDEYDNSRHVIERCNTHLQDIHKPEMSDKQLGFDDILNDSVSWTNGVFQSEKFDNICICHATKQLVIDNSFSIPDLLRINNVWVEATITCQHIRKLSSK